MSKVNLLETFWFHFISDRIILRNAFTKCFQLCKKMKDADCKTLGTSKDKKLLVKVRNGCFPIELYVFAIFGTLRKHQCSKYAVCYKILLIFQKFRIFSYHHID